jgi:hypothetical protein
MDNNFKLRAALKSDEELHNCVENREKYLPESVEAAVAELQNRGEEFSDEELKVIAEDMQARRALAEIGSNSFSIFTGEAKNNQIEDPDGPSFFSKGAILLFSFLSVFFGSILLAINIYKTPHRSKTILVLLYGFGFTMLVNILALSLKLGAIFAIGGNCAGAYSMEVLFWNNYIGAPTLYRPRSIWVPAIIAIILIAFNIIVFFYGKKFLDPALFK